MPFDDFTVIDVVCPEVTDHERNLKGTGLGAVPSFL